MMRQAAAELRMAERKQAAVRARLDRERQVLEKEKAVKETATVHRANQEEALRCLSCPNPCVNILQYWR